MDQIRATFLAFLTVLGLGATTVGLYARRNPTSAAKPAQPAPQVTRVVIADDIAPPSSPVAQQISATPTETLAAKRAPIQIVPIFSADNQTSDGLPRFVCGASAIGPYLTLVNIQTARLDIAHGFHLGIVPFGIDPATQASEAERAQLVSNGTLDCLLTSTEAVKRNTPGTITLLAGQRPQTSQLWVRGITALDELPGKRIAFERGGEGEALMAQMLSKQDSDQPTATLVPVDTMADAVDLFVNGDADAGTWD